MTVVQLPATRLQSSVTATVASSGVRWARGPRAPRRGPYRRRGGGDRARHAEAEKEHGREEGAHIRRLAALPGLSGVEHQRGVKACRLDRWIETGNDPHDERRGQGVVGAALVPGPVAGQQ